MEINLHVENKNRLNVRLSVFLDGVNCGELRVARPDFGKLIEVLHRGKAPEDVFAVSGLDGDHLNASDFWSSFSGGGQYTEYNWKEFG
jgi:hypothetical protein